MTSYNIQRIEPDYDTYATDSPERDDLEEVLYDLSQSDTYEWPVIVLLDTGEEQYVLNGHRRYYQALNRRESLFAFVVENTSDYHKVRELIDRVHESGPITINNSLGKQYLFEEDHLIVYHPGNNDTRYSTFNEVLSLARDISSNLLHGGYTFEDYAEDVAKLPD